MSGSETTVTPDVFHAATMTLDSRFLPNYGGDGSNGLSRAIYELIPYKSESEPTLTLELYAKFNADDPNQRELHGNLILQGKIDDLSDVYMGFLFSPTPIHGTFDGLQVLTKQLDKSKTDNTMESFDLWTKTRPFTTEAFNPINDFKAESGIDSSNDWNIVAQKSWTQCDTSGTCTLKAHFNRVFDTQDSEDYQFEHGKYLGYDVIGYYRVKSNSEDI